MQVIEVWGRENCSFSRFLQIETADFHTSAILVCCSLVVGEIKTPTNGKTDFATTHFLNGERGCKIDAALQSEAPRLVIEFRHLDRSQLSHFRVWSVRLPIKHVINYSKMETKEIWESEEQKKTTRTGLFDRTRHVSHFATVLVGSHSITERRQKENGPSAISPAPGSYCSTHFLLVPFEICVHFNQLGKHVNLLTLI